MTEFAVVGSSSSQRKVQVQNVGACRITGAELLAKGKRLNWLYLLTDIGTVCVFQNQGEDVWLGTNGIPVAGGTDVQLMLVPFEGQRYYNIELAMPLEYKGGSWEGVEYAEFQTPSPTTRYFEESGTLSLGRLNVAAVSELSLWLPANAVKGCEFQLLVLPDCEDVYIKNAENFRTSEGETLEQLLAPNRQYIVVYDGVQWVLHNIITEVTYLRADNNLSDLEDVDAAKEFLGVLPPEFVFETVNKVVAADASLDIQGDVSEGLRRARVVFATAQEFLQGNSTKAVTSDLIVNFTSALVADANKFNPYNNVSGLTGNSLGFSLTGKGQAFLSYGPFEFFINREPFLRTSDLELYSYASDSIAVPNLSELSQWYLVADSSSVRLEPDYEPDNPLVILLGYATLLSGTVLSVLAAPQLASSYMQLRVSPTAFVPPGITPSQSLAGRIKSAAYSITLEGANWDFNKNSPHTRAFEALDPTPFVLIKSNGQVVSGGSTFIDGRVLEDGSSVPEGKYSIQVLYVTITGVYVLLQASNVYDNLNDAKAAAVTYQPSLDVAEQNLTEVGRLIIKSDQFPGSTTLDLNNPLNFEFLRLASQIGSSSDSEGVTWRHVTGGGLLQPGISYHIEDGDTYELPAANSNVQYVVVRTHSPNEPLITCVSDLYDSFTGSAGTELEFDSGGHPITFVSKETIWRF